MKKFSLAIFDLDGTLLDTSGGLVASFRKALEINDLPMPDETCLKAAIGPPFHQFLRDNYTHLTEKEISRITNDFRNIYMTDEYLFRAEPYAGILELWKSYILRGVNVAVATNKRQDYAVRLLEHFGFDRYSRHLYGTDFDNKMKKSDVIRLCLTNTGVDAEDAVMIGDAKGDAEGAAAVGIDFVGVTYGFGFKSAPEILRFKNAVGYADNVNELKNIFSEEIL